MADLWSTLSGGRLHTGSFMGLPDAGITEGISSLLGGGRTAQGGSNLQSGGLPTAQVPNGSSYLPVQGPGLGWNGSGDVLGTQTQTGSNTNPLSNVSNLPGGTSGGVSSGDSRLDQLSKTARNPVEEDEYQRLLREMQGSAANQAQIELEQALGEYDRQAEGLQAQSGQLDTQYQSARNTLSGKQGEALQEGARAKQEATDTTQSAQRKLLSTAQDVQRSNRNVLRALGILSSSAAGQMLSKPLNEYASQAGELQQGLVKRIGVVEDWLLNRQSEFTQQTKDLESQYANLKENISRDLRFNARDRISAIKAAGAALQQRQQEIQQQSLQYANAAKQYSDNILMKIAEMQMYQNPTADTSGILNTLLSGAQAGQRAVQPQQTALAQTDEQRRRLSGLA